MIKIATIAAVASIAAFAIAAPASASEIRVSVAGKTIAQLDAELTNAARTVCKRDTAGSFSYNSEYASCFKASLADAHAQLQKFAAAEGKQFASR
ncbi:UrcA family protein [Phenylobacterium aquaticum]|uniref:UrcA family protein n=1 Tax=Phenylobacterium aquaticum TaxID=1763816 RepID=UPI001F5D453D|nr:UrcA family protein [Phenylobacterium aquaticum]MCI3135401.1 UrcA family protein [Phenylobacterium aquaticum]